ncbi:ATP-binding protein [Sphingomonas sp. HITSZ_GF]|uniref:ATP-binding protein n=1 Tax=Sphingomonas sp. HITSZ_GF TaxID=3037247 RepID=UPI00240E7371|nr:ATP-binding protein [Sphingomonas sp. HITSZ_GF]MDG2535251.1 ATP-binding protein [Sphingomonas sp. HITSZ_GF]
MGISMPEASASGEVAAQPELETVAFKTRARTIDHLGRGQIADAPTAVSELWKNAWDAYATQVSLNIFDGDPVIAAVFDDGVGMSASDFTDRWLVVGTESKVDGPPPPPPKFFKGPPRQRQGEKGIGRLSAAFLAPATLVLSQQENGTMSAVLVDWRLFENPYLSLDDITLPVRTFADPSTVLSGLASMADVLLGNLSITDEDGAQRPNPAWERFSEEERDEGRTPTAETLRKFWFRMPIEQRHLDEWPVMAKLDTHGTALFMLGAHHELSVWLGSSHEDEEAERVKGRLKDILTGFTDTLAEKPVQFEYEVLAYRGEVPRRILASSDIFDLEQFRDLEHTVEGSFDAAGVFRGNIKAFGKDLGERIIPPPRPLPSAPSEQPGPFDFCIGTFEQVATSSSHNARRHSDLAAQVQKYGGVRVYRDSLRVMPYGSADADFFSLEETRQKHAGRYFWAHRRSFGRLAFTRSANPYLRDKAGREGLVENRASRELRILVQSLLIGLARDYFGTDAPERSERIAEAQSRNVKGKKAADEVRKKRRAEFSAYLKDAVARMPMVAARAQSISARIEDLREDPNREDIAVLRGEVEQTRADITGLTPTDVPRSLGSSEERYRSFRDELDDARELIRISDDVLRDLEAKDGIASPREVARAVQTRHRDALNRQLDGYQQQIRENIRAATGLWTGDLAEDKERYDKATAPFLRNLSTSTNLVDILSLLELNRRELEAEFADRYRPLIRNVAAVLEGIDAETALTAVDEDREELERRVRDLSAVAQLGITVEIIAHELEMLDSEVTRNLERLPQEVQGNRAFSQALSAHHALTEKLRFLSPLQLAGARIRERITGARIADYVNEFFGEIFQGDHVEFFASPAFRGIEFTELPSRIFPVFVNLVNNSLYWVGRQESRRIHLDFVDEKIVVADSGPGVDKDDIGRLFQLFFTRRNAGRGVGLYLARVNLEAGRHIIRYATDDDPHVLPGANFIIEIRGVSSSG